MQDVYIIVPAYNESGVIYGVLSDLLKNFPNVVCVNDGSKDTTAQEVRKTKATLVTHPINLGQGAALQTGIEYALLDPKAKYFVTFDSDGQHRIEDVKKMLQEIRKDKHDILLGSRFLGEAKNITKVRKALLKAAVVFTRTTSGLKVTDAHNGLRVFNRLVAEGLNITMPDMAHGSEIIERIAEKKFRYKELPVTIQYTDYSQAKGQSALNAINVGFDIILNRIVKK